MKNKTYFLTLLTLCFFFSLPAIGQISNLRDFFGETRFVILGPSLELNLDPQEYPLNYIQYMVMSYPKKNEHIIKELSFTGQKVFINTDDILKKLDRSGMVTELNQVEFYYRVSGKDRVVARITLVLVPEKVIAHNWLIISINLKNRGLSQQEIRNAAAQYIIDCYGSPSSEQMETYLNKYFN